jgi:hypothetical protein
VKRCQACHEPFAGEHWQRLCWPCWRERQDREQHADSYARGYDDGYAAGYRRACQDQPVAQQSSLDTELIAAAIRLCHPDSHPPERFDLANRITARLLELRA